MNDSDGQVGVLAGVHIVATRGKAAVILEESRRDRLFLC